MNIRRQINNFRPALEILEQRLAPANAASLAAYGQLPLSFEANEGQTAPQVQYLTQGSGYSLFLTSSGAVLSLSQQSGAGLQTRPAGSGEPSHENGLSPNTTTTGVAIALNLVGANPNAAVTGLDALPGTSNYFIGNDPSQWHTNITNYSKVEYQNVYPGISLVYYGNQQQLEYDYQVAPGADPSTIRFAVQGADSVTLDAQGNLVLHTATGDVLEKAPVIYQQVDGTQKAVSGQFVLLGNNEVGFQVGAYDATLPLVIDPVLSYSTYLGGIAVGYGIAVDGSGNAYVTGTTGTDFPTTVGAFQASFGGSEDVFVTKLNASGTTLLYSTYLGGSGNDVGLAIAVDGSGNAYITGYILSNNFPTTAGALQTSQLGTEDAFVTKLNAGGTALLYSTYLGGENDDVAYGIAVDSSGNAYVSGYTRSSSFPTTAGAFQATNAGNYNAFVTKLNASGTGLAYSTYLGGNGTDVGEGIAVDGSGNAYVTGLTSSTNFPTTAGAFQTSYGSGYDDVFVTKLNASGTSLPYSTYLGDNNGDEGSAIAVDGSGNTYVTGYTSSTNFPTTAAAFQTSYGGSWDAFVTKLNANGTGLIYSTYLGGTGVEEGYGIAVDGSGNAYVTGFTSSTNFPTTTGAFQTSHGSDSGGYGYDSFATKLNASGAALLYSTYLGGNNDDEGYGVAVDGSGNAYITGSAKSTNFPTSAGAFQTTYVGGYQDGFVAKFVFLSSTTTTLTDNGPNPSNIGQAVSFTAAVSGGAIIDGETVFIEDASNANAVVASPTLSGGAVTFSISDLTVGTHDLFAVYNGDANNAASNDSLTPVVQIVNAGALAPAVSSVAINGGAPQYTDGNGTQVSLAGQNSIVEQILVTFNEAVTLDANAFSITNNAGAVTVLGGIPAPTTDPVGLNAPIAVAGSGGTQFILTFLAGSGTTAIPGGTGAYIKDGVYILNTDGSKVHANSQTAADNHAGFWVLFGSVAADNLVSANIGDGNSDILVDTPDAAQFKIAFGSENDSSLLPDQPYDAAMDSNLSGVIGTEDAAKFKHNFGAEWEF